MMYLTPEDYRVGLKHEQDYYFNHVEGIEAAVYWRESGQAGIQYLEGLIRMTSDQSRILRARKFLSMVGARHEGTSNRSRRA